MASLGQEDPVSQGNQQLLQDPQLCITNNRDLNNRHLPKLRDSVEVVVA